MPLVAAAFIAHAAGLLLGFGGFFVFGSMGVVAVGAEAARRRRPEIGALALLGAAGMLRAAVATRADADCARRAADNSNSAAPAMIATCKPETDSRCTIPASA